MESNSLNKLIKNLQLFFLKKLRKSNYYFKKLYGNNLGHINKSIFILRV